MTDRHLSPVRARTVIFKLFGSVGLVADGRLLAIQGGRQRTLLATLLINSGKVVTKEQFFEELWEGQAAGEGEQRAAGAGHPAAQAAARPRSARSSPASG